MAKAERKSDYQFRDWWPIIQKKDWTPGLGLVLRAERTRKTRGESLAGSYLPWKFPAFRSGKERAVKELITLGTASWPEPTSRAANLRANLMAARNVIFVSYHVMLMSEGLIQGPKVVRYIAQLLQG